MFAPEKSKVATSMGIFKETTLAGTSPEFTSKYTESPAAGINPAEAPPETKDHLKGDDQEPLPPTQ
jgi:hypothetical protein